MLKRLGFVSKMHCKNGICKPLYGSQKNFVKKRVNLLTYPNYFGDVTRNNSFLFFGLIIFEFHDIKKIKKMLACLYLCLKIKDLLA